MLSAKNYGKLVAEYEKWKSALNWNKAYGTLMVIQKRLKELDDAPVKHESKKWYWTSAAEKPKLFQPIKDKLEKEIVYTLGRLGRLRVDPEKYASEFNPERRHVHVEDGKLSSMMDNRPVTTAGGHWTIVMTREYQLYVAPAGRVSELLAGVAFTVSANFTSTDGQLGAISSQAERGAQAFLDLHTILQHLSGAGVKLDGISATDTVGKDTYHADKLAKWDGTNQAQLDRARKTGGSLSVNF